MKHSLLVVLCGLVALATTSSAALAGGDVPTRIQRQPGTPLAVTRCAVRHDIVLDSLGVNLTNRTKHAMLSFEVEVRAYDVEHAQVATGKVTIAPSDILSSGDSNSYSALVDYSSITEQNNAWAYMTCRLVKATFTGHKEWAYGHRWNEPLLPMDADSSAGESGDSSPAGGPPRGHRHAPLSFSVSRAWNDHFENALIVHAALVLTGGATPSTVTPSAFHLTMRLANGGTKTYEALERPAPTYQKMNPFGSETTTAYEVAPKDDLGAIGSLTVGAHETVSIIASFVVPDIVADPGANSNISMR